MGQQQLLLLILVTVIVGIMTVIAINLYNDSRDEGYKDIIRQDMLEAATNGQMYFKKSQVFGGGGLSFVNITLSDVQLDSANAIASFEITETTQNYFRLTATPTSDIAPLVLAVYEDNVTWD